MLELRFSHATRDQLPTIVALIDQGAAKTLHASANSDPAHFERLFDAIQTDPNQALWVAHARDELVGTFLLTFLPTLAYGGHWRGQLESVHVRADRRGQGVGAAMMRHALDLCRDKGCTMVQLTSHKSRSDAHRFYGRLGFTASHEGFKLAL